jgi:hypothetical protein
MNLIYIFLFLLYQILILSETSLSFILAIYCNYIHIKMFISNLSYEIYKFILSKVMHIIIVSIFYTFFQKKMIKTDY